MASHGEPAADIGKKKEKKETSQTAATAATAATTAATAAASYCLSLFSSMILSILSSAWKSFERRSFFYSYNFCTLLHRMLLESPDCQPTLTSGSLASNST